MICDQCRARFGRIGVDYWTARSGTCPFCKAEKRAFLDTIKALGNDTNQ
jgi:hypothetical protein